MTESKTVDAEALRKLLGKWDARLNEHHNTSRFPFELRALLGDTPSSPGDETELVLLTEAAITRSARAANSDPEVELARLRQVVESAIELWSCPHVEAMGTVQTTIDDAATLLIDELRAAGYAANFVINYPGLVIFALDPADAPSPDEVMENAFR